jgi:hypothetical protein
MSDTHKSNALDNTMTRHIGGDAEIVLSAHDYLHHSALISINARFAIPFNV